MQISPSNFWILKQNLPDLLYFVKQVENWKSSSNSWVAVPRGHLTKNQGLNSLKPDEYSVDHNWTACKLHFNFLRCLHFNFFQLTLKSKVRSEIWSLMEEFDFDQPWPRLKIDHKNGFEHLLSVTVITKT